ncbi:GMC family oxidoreductase [Chloroflexia bacterium SDU3-3]|nr:GMC family oxidoreductase [Chloroflexia bacterium SDU3-3]
MVFFPRDKMTRTSAEQVGEEIYDVVIVGGGVAGAIIAKQLSAAHKRVLVVESGMGKDVDLAGYESYVSRFYGTAMKDNQSPYPINRNSPMPRSTDARKITPGLPATDAYIVQNGPFGSDTTYTRVLGGTTMHWEAKTPRMVPDDFSMRNTFGVGENWPISYDEIEPDYREAEREMGVSADVEDQRYLGISFPDDYVYPMRKMPLSYLDQQVDQGIRGTSVQLGGQQFDLEVRSFPQARNGIPNPLYNGGKGYRPLGAVSTSQVEAGERCQGNNNCVPICPVQAKYYAGKTMAQALLGGDVKVLTQAVASRVVLDADGRVSHIEIKQYHDPILPDHTTATVRGRVFVLAANAIENPRLMLASGLAGSSGLMGRNLMDHAYLLCWGLMPQVCGTMRGTNCTGGIVALRNGSFRSQQAAFGIDIHNDGWGWSEGSPASDLLRLVDGQNKFGRSLRRELADSITRQLLLAFMIEVLPDPNNRVSVDPAYKDQLGNMRPVVTYNIPEYTMRGAAYARRFAQLVFQRLGVADYTHYDPGDYGYVTYEGAGYAIRGGNHLAGTHIMGSSPSTSVVDPDQRSWDHANLFLVGGGSMPSIGTANVTLTIAALCFRTARAIIADLA